jgi:hypothetical protein
LSHPGAAEWPQTGAAYSNENARAKATTNTAVEVELTAKKGSGSVIPGNAHCGVWFQLQALSQLFFQFSDQRGQPLFVEGVNRLSGQSAGLFQPTAEAGPLR